jgi:Fe-S cluster assembly ATP-binding protein
MLKICRPNITANEIETDSAKLNMFGFLDREVNLGFSGGEAKRAEMLQIFAQAPEFIMFDEPDSGVDLENIELIGKMINDYLMRHAGLIITHQGYILNFINATRACVLYDGQIICHGNAKAILDDIKTKGYAGCIQCQKKD